MATATLTRADAARVQSKGQRALSDDQVRYILTSPEAVFAKARRLGCAYQTVQNVLYNRTYQTVLPELPRWQPPVKGGATHNQTCWQCAHHRTYYIEVRRKSTQPRVCCGLGLPDPVEEGARFARYCNVFLRAEKRDAA